MAFDIITVVLLILFMAFLVKAIVYFYKLHIAHTRHYQYIPSKAFLPETEILHNAKMKFSENEDFAEYEQQQANEIDSRA